MSNTVFDAKEKRDLLKKGFSADEIQQLEIQRDPSLWAETYLTDPEHPRQPLKLRDYQKEMISYQGRKKVYRCVAEDCKVLLSNGLWVPIKDIKSGDIVVSYDKYKLKDGKVLNTFNNGTREVFRVLLNNGSYIDVTSDHELFSKIKTNEKYLLSRSGFNDKPVYRSKTKTLWSTIDNGLKVGDNVCVIRGYNIFGNVNNHTLAKFLGYMLTDGYFGKSGQTPKFTSNTIEYINEVKELSKELFGYDCVIKKRQEANAFDCYITDSDKGTSNLCNKFCSDYNITDAKYNRKKLPDIINTLDEESIGVFINRLFAGDGCVSTWSSKTRPNSGEIKLTSQHRTFIEDIQVILLKKDIHSFIKYEQRPSPSNPTKLCDVYYLCIGDGTSIRNFLDWTGHIYGKEKQSLKILEQVSNRKYLRKLRGCSKTTKWEKILSIASLGHKNVYDIEVDEYHNFVCNGIITHNCGRRIGKCKNINDLHVLTDGRRVSYGQLLNEYKQGIQNEIFVFNKDTQKIETTKDFSVWSNGVKSLIKLTTETGRVESATSNHPFLVIRDGEFKWIELGSLKLKDRIACPKKLDMTYTKSIDDTNGVNVAFFLGYLMGDGGLTHSVIFTNKDLSVIEHLKTIAISLGFTDFRLEEVKDKNCYNLHIKAGDNKKWARHLLGEFKLYGKKSIYKEIPEQLYMAPKDELKSFLSALYECDGWASVAKPQNNRKSGSVQIGYCSSSYKLAEGVKHLLLRFGIIARLKEKKVNLNGKQFISYQVTINDRENILRFIDEINFSCTKKQDAQSVKEELETKNYCDNSSLYTIPKDIHTRIKKIQKEKNLTNYQVLGNTNRTDNTRLRSYQDFSKAKLNIYADNLNDDFLKKLCNNDIVWEKIVKLENDGQHETVDLTVEKYHNFVGNDIISHNSVSLAIEALWLAFVNEGIRILICTPYKAQTANLWKDGFNKLIKGNPLLESSIAKMGQNPYLIEFKNGSRILGLTAGSSTGNKGASIRGQNADILILDEVDYMGEEAIQTIQAIAATSRKTRVIISSTPTGKREYFYESCTNKTLGFKEFYFPSSHSPEWVSIAKAKKLGLPLHESQEYLFRNTVPESEYKHEYEAEFGEENQGVFKHKYIDNALVKYETNKEEIDSNGLKWYCGAEQIEGNIYSMGVDWNGTKVGTQIVITEYCRTPTVISSLIDQHSQDQKIEHETVTGKYRVFYRESVSIEQMTQLHSIKRIIELNERFKIDHMYVDAGFGTCVAPDTLISTINGVKEIQYIHRDDRVLTADGTYQQVLNKIVKQCADNYIVRPSQCMPVTVSYCHPFFVYSSVNKFNDTTITEKDLLWKDVRYINKKKDLLAIPKSVYRFNDETSDILDLTTVIKDGIDFNETEIWLRKNTLQKHPRYINVLSSEFQIIAAWFLSKGSVNSRSIKIPYSDSVINDINELKSSLLQCLNAQVHEYTYVNKYNNNVRFIVINNKLVTLIFEKLFGKYNENKHIPVGMIKHPRQLSLFMKTYIHTIRKSNDIKLSSISASLTYQMRQILIDNDILPSVNSKVLKDKTRFFISVIDHECINRTMKFINIEGESLPINKRKKYIELTNYFLVPIKSIKNSDTSLDLVDIQVENTHSFCGNGILLHNTNIEELRLYGQRSPESQINKKLKPIDFGSKVVVYDPFTKEEVEKAMKPFCVNNAVTCLERNELILPESEDEKVKLVGQMREYRIEKISPTGTPRYSEDNDHILDAFNLSLLAFQMEYSELIKLKHSSDIDISRRPIGLIPGLDQVGDRSGTMESKDIIEALGVRKRGSALNAESYHSDSRGAHMDYEDLMSLTPSAPSITENISPFTGPGVSRGWTRFNAPSRTNF